MLKKLLPYFTLVVVAISGNACIKSNSGACSPVEPAAEEPVIVKYLSDNSISAVKDPSGMFYQIINQGTGGAPTVNSKINVTYSGYLLNGTKFDEKTSPEPNKVKWWTLSGLIPGWQIGIPKIQKGGKIKMIIPSSLGYGCYSTGVIPANSVLVFDVELVDFE